MVASFRYGYSVFPDGRNCRGGSPGQGCFTDGLASLGFNQTYLNAVDDTAENLFPIGHVPELFDRRSEPQHGADQMGKPDHPQRRALEAGWAAHREIRRRFPDHAADHDPPEQHRRQLYLSESLHGGTESRRRIRLRQFPAGRGDHRLGRLQPGRRRVFVELRRRIHSGRLAGEFALHAELRPPLRARERTAREGQQHHGWIRSDGHQCRAAGHRCRGPKEWIYRSCAQGRPDVRRRQRRERLPGQSAGGEDLAACGHDVGARTPTPSSAAAMASSMRRGSTRNRATAPSVSRARRRCRSPPRRAPCRWCRSTTRSRPG